MRSSHERVCGRGWGKNGMETRRERLFLKFLALNTLHRGGQDLFVFNRKTHEGENSRYLFIAMDLSIGI